MHENHAETHNKVYNKETMGHQWDVSWFLCHDLNGEFVTANACWDNSLDFAGF